MSTALNSPCPCGSGKKYKMCCYEADRKAAGSKRKKRMIIAIIIAAMLVGVVVAYAIYEANLPGQYDDFAKCLTNKGYEVYGASWCEKCQEQKALFGKALRYVRFVECDEDGDHKMSEQCKSKGIEKFPTWLGPEKWRAEGVHTIAELAEKSSCPLVSGNSPGQ